MGGKGAGGADIRPEGRRTQDLLTSAPSATQGAEAAEGSWWARCLYPILSWSVLTCRSLLWGGSFSYKELVRTICE